MQKRISVTQFSLQIEIMKNKYPNATVASIGTGIKNHEWHFTIWLKDGEKEICYQIPMYERGYV